MMDKPVHVLQRGEEVRGIVNVAALAVVDAQSRHIVKEGHRTKQT